MDDQLQDDQHTALFDLPEAADGRRRLVEAMLFAADAPLSVEEMAGRLPEGTDIGAILNDLEDFYRARGINLVRRGEGWAFQTAADLRPGLVREVERPKKLARAALETMAVIAYHQPVTRGEIETIRGVAASRGTIDQLVELGWVKPGRRRESVGRPLTWVTTEGFLAHFNLEHIHDLPSLEELRVAGFLDSRPAIAALAEQYGLSEVPTNEAEDEAPDSASSANE